MTLRLVPPIAVPFGLSAIARGVFGRSQASLNHALAERTGRKSVELFASGRVALAHYLTRIRTAERDEVVVPAYTCWSVAASIVNAGLRPRPVDVDPITFRVDLDGVRRAIGPRTVAVIAAHLLGPTENIGEVATAVREVDPLVRVIEDAAQAWPSARTSADAVVLSFSRGKPFPLGGGGALMHDGPASRPPAESHSAALGDVLRLAVTCVLSHPVLYRIPASIPALEIGRTNFEPAFDRMAGFHRWQIRFGARQLEAVDGWIAQRTSNARRLRERLADNQRLEWPDVAAAEGPLRLPLLAPNRNARDGLVRGLRRHGVSASAMYPDRLDRIPGLVPVSGISPLPLPGASSLVGRLLTLPIYPSLGRRQLDAVARAFERSLAECNS